MAVGEDYPVSAVTNADCSMSVVVTTWLTLYPHGTFRAMLRRSLGDPVVLYEWRGSGGDLLGEIRVVTAGEERLVLMKMPARDAKRIGPLSGGVYDVVIEDASIDMKRKIFGGAFTIEHGVTM